MRATTATFPDCAFPSIAADTRIACPPARAVEAFLHDVAQFVLLGLCVQLSTYVTWSLSGLEAFALLPEGVSYATNGIQLSGAIQIGPYWTHHDECNVLKRANIRIDQPGTGSSSKMWSLLPG